MSATTSETQTKIPMVDLRAQFAPICDEICAAIDDVIGSLQFVLGPQLATLEQEMAQYCGARYAVGVASGTDALLLALRACGIGPGDEVIVPTFSFIATASTVSWLGAHPVFADIDPATFNLDAAQAAAKLTPKTRAIIPVHLYGLPAEMDPLLELAAPRGITVIEDNAQSIGAAYKGRKTGAMGALGCISFYPSKNLGAYGDAGMIVTATEEFSQRLRRLRDHGQSRKYFSEELSLSSRLDEIQAAVLRVKLRHLPEWTKARQTHAARYTERLGGLRGVVTPVVPAGCEHVFYQYTIRVTGAPRDRVQKFLAERGIASAVHYPVPLHLQPVYASLGHKRGDFPVAERAADEALSLPLYPELTPEQIDSVADAVGAAVAQAPRGVV